MANAQLTAFEDVGVFSVCPVYVPPRNVSLSPVPLVRCNSIQLLVSNLHSEREANKCPASLVLGTGLALHRWHQTLHCNGVLPR